MKKQNRCSLKVGDKVRYARNWLRSTGTYTGDLCFCKGKITKLVPLGSTMLAEIDWCNPDIPRRVNVANLEKVGTPINCPGKSTMTNTQKALQEMFIFNTGSHMLDSGGIYGRHHERNRALATEGKTYLDLEPAIVDFDSCGIGYTRQVCPWLEEQCDYREDLQTEFDTFATNDEHKDETWLECLKLWLESKGVEVKYSENTYNSNCCISQVVQYYIFELKDENVTIAAVCLHQGCDVRGGYSKPFFFEVDDCICGVADGYLRCSNANEDHYWTTDDGCTWSWQGCYGSDVKNLEDYKFSDDPKDKGKGKIYYNDEGKGYCPICGELLGT